MVKQLYEWDLLMVSHVPVRFDGHRHRGSADKIFLVCHVISQDHLTKRQINIMGRSGLRLVIIPLSLVAQALSQWRYNSFSLSRDLAKPIDQRVQKHYEQKPLKVSKHPAKFAGHSTTLQVYLVSAAKIFPENISYIFS